MRRRAGGVGPRSGRAGRGRRSPAAPALVLALALGLGGLLAGEAAPRAACVPTTPRARQARTAVKHRPPPPDTTSAAVPLAEMFGWDAPADVSVSAVRRSNRTIDERERRAFTIEGNVWRVKLEADDCDLHVEMSPLGTGRRARRVIVEVPDDSGSAAAREALLARLGHPRAAAEGRPFLRNLREPIPARVTGYAFYDATHWRARAPRRGQGHGTVQVATLWELHPVWRLRFLE